ncbi:MAG: GlsB/YeaQ/YmgE family stress response membrane protein [bacterium]
MGLLGWIVLGGVAGWLASLLMDERQGCLLNVVVGVVGAVIGGLLFSRLGRTGFTGFNIWSLGIAIVGSVLFLFLLRLLRGKRDRRRR